MKKIKVREEDESKYFKIGHFTPRKRDEYKEREGESDHSLSFSPICSALLFSLPSPHVPS